MSYREPQPEWDKQFRPWPSEKAWPTEMQDRRCGLWVRNNMGRLLSLHPESAGDPFYDSCKRAYEILMQRGG